MEACESIIRSANNATESPLQTIYINTNIEDVCEQVKCWLPMNGLQWSKLYDPF